MRILYLSQLIPYPPDAGAKVRSYYTLRYLAQKHQVTLLAFSRPEDPPAAIEHLQSFLEAVYTVPIRRSVMSNLLSLVKSLLSGRSFIIERDYIPDLADKVDELLASGKFDAVHADQIYMVQYGLRAARTANGFKPLLVVDKHNADYLIFKRMADGEPNPLKRIFLKRERRLIERFEAATCQQFDHVVTVSAEDRCILEKLVGESSLRRSGSESFGRPVFTTIPICVDTAQVQPAICDERSKMVLYLGGLHWPPNAEGVNWFAQQVWPHICEQIPSARLIVGGKNPPPSIRALDRVDGRLTVGIENNSPIRVLGYIPDAKLFIDQAALFIVPLFSGSGMRVKIVDAWNWGLPVVSTSIGAEGIQYRDGENILIADSAQDFAQAVMQILKDPKLNQSLRLNGRCWVEEHYDWRRIYPAWDMIYG